MIAGTSTHFKSRAGATSLPHPATAAGSTNPIAASCCRDPDIRTGLGLYRRIASVVLLTWLIWLTLPAARAQTVDRIEILALGIFEVEIVGRTGTDEGPTEVLNTLARARLVSRTTSIPIRRCVTFGFEYVVGGGPRGAEISLRMVTRVPAPGLRNPHSGRVAREIETVVPRQIGRRHLRAYTLEHEWELIPGTWALEIWQGRRRLAAQSFTLVGRCEGDCRTGSEHESCGQEAISSLRPHAGSIDAIHRPRGGG